MNFTRIRYFRSVATMQSFRRAAEVVGISQPSLSRQIRILEHECGATLFHRVSNRIQLTQAGEMLLERSATLLAEMEHLKKNIGRLKSGQKAHLFVGAIQSTLEHTIPAAIGILRAAHPDLHISVRGFQSHEIIERVSRGHLDVCVVATPVGDPRIDVEPIAREAFTAVLPINHRLAGASRIRIDDLSADALITFPKPFIIREMIDTAARHRGGTLDAVIELESIEAIKALVRQGTGVSILPRSATLGAAGRMGLSTVALDEPLLFRDVVAARLVTEQSNRALVDEFIAALKAVYSDPAEIPVRRRRAPR